MNLPKPHQSAAEEPPEPEAICVDGIDFVEAISEYQHQYRAQVLEQLSYFAGDYWTRRTTFEAIDLTLGDTPQQQAARDAAAMKAFRIAWATKLGEIVTDLIEDARNGGTGPLSSWVNEQAERNAEPDTH